MKGNILQYNFSESKGLISAENGDRYEFDNSQWKASDIPKENMEVDFAIDGTQAKDIFLLKNDQSNNNVSNADASGLYKSSDDKVLTGVLGGLAHKFGMSTGIARVIGFFAVGFTGIGFIAYIAMAVALKGIPTKEQSSA